MVSHMIKNEGAIASALFFYMHELTYGWIDITREYIRVNDNNMNFTAEVHL